ncbi:MAG: hypothetical protein KDC18_06745 [Alphaproteobacteria bacterium]|nr:hypothetical protein [Alphaproteobacteria bacterium]MCB9929192.1 hypothetical protein [Alphaproteobacteria bacterium]
MGSTTELRALVLYYLHGLLARRWTILIVAWIVCVAGWFVVAMLPNVYTSSARIFVDTQSLLRPLMKDLAVQPDVERQVDMMRRTLLTRPNVEQIVRKSDLDLTVATPLELDRLIDRLARNINIKVEGPNLFRIEYSTRTPQLAQRVVDTTLQIFVDMNLGDAQQDMESARRFIDEQIAEYEKKLRNSELQVAEFKRSHSDQLSNTERLQRELDRAEQEMSNLQSSLQSSTWQMDQLQVQLSGTPQYSETTTTAGGSPRGQLQAQLAQQKAELARLQAQYTDRHPDVIAQRNLVAHTEQLLSTASGGSVSRIKTQNQAWGQIKAQEEQVTLAIKSINARIAQQQKVIDDLVRRVGQTPEAEAELVHLTRDHDVLLRQYQLLIERRESARMAERMGAEADNVKFRIIDPPVEPTEPSGPPRVLLMAAVLLLGLGLGGAIAFLRILLVDAFVNAKQLTETLGLPVIGTLSVARTAMDGPRRVLEVTLAVAVVASLFLSFGGLSYLYTANPGQPALQGAVKNAAQAVMRRFGPSQ